MTILAQTKVIRRRVDGAEQVRISGGRARIGSELPGARPNQKPVHEVELSPFFMDVEPVSCAAYASFLNSADASPAFVERVWLGLVKSDASQAPVGIRHSGEGWEAIPGAERLPMILVSWLGANAYSLWANGLDWRFYPGDGSIAPEFANSRADASPPKPETLWSSLPSEAQWEFAARGPEPRRYSWGNSPAEPSLANVARHQCGQGVTYTDIFALPLAEVGEELGVSPFGPCGMSGNVWQWCRDWFAHDFYQRPESRGLDPQNTTPSGLRSERGGSWVGAARLAESSYRRGRPPEAAGRCLGFRCVSQPD